MQKSRTHFHEPIQIKQRNLRILQNNCVSCHEPMVSHLLADTVTGEAVNCFTCHHSVGHGARSAGMPRRFPLVYPDRTGAEP